MQLIHKEIIIGNVKSNYDLNNLKRDKALKLRKHINDEHGIYFNIKRTHEKRINKRICWMYKLCLD